MLGATHNYAKQAKYYNNLTVVLRAAPVSIMKPLNELLKYGDAVLLMAYANKIVWSEPVNKTEFTVSSTI